MLDKTTVQLRLPRMSCQTLLDGSLQNGRNLNRWLQVLRLNHTYKLINWGKKVADGRRITLIMLVVYDYTIPQNYSSCDTNAQSTIKKPWKYWCFILIRNYQRCIYTSPEMGRKSRTNMYQPKTLAIASPDGLLTVCWNSTHDIVAPIRYCQLFLTRMKHLYSTFMV